MASEKEPIEINWDIVTGKIGQAIQEYVSIEKHQEDPMEEIKSLPAVCELKRYFNEMILGKESGFPEEEDSEIES